MNGKTTTLKLKVRYGKAYLLISAVIFGLTRLLGDSLLFLFINYHSDTIIIWKFITGILIAVTLFSYIFSSENNSEQNLDSSPEKYFREMNFLLLLAFFFMIFAGFKPDLLNRIGMPNNVYQVISIDAISMFTVYFAFSCGRFLDFWLSVRRHKKTRIYNGILAYGLLFIAFFDAVGITLGIFEGTSLDSFVTTLLTISLLIVLWINSRKNTWIAILPRNQKIKLALSSVLGVGIFTLLTVFAGNQVLEPELDFFLPGLSAFAGLTFMLIDLYFLRIFFAAVVSIPTSGIVERRTSELSSLTYLNRMVARTIDFDTLLNTVTRLALESCQASGAWTELYVKEKVRVKSTQFISKDQILQIHKNPELKEKFMYIRTPLLIESVPEDPELRYINETIESAHSLMAVPLFAGSERIGTLVVVHPEEFGFERDDIQVIAAFSDNISIALENARLLKDSLEKEHYKRELLIAKSIQKKLLPSEVPQIRNYSIDAFSNPAEEVGGDFYDMGLMNNGNYCIVIGDVSGKGMNAAFYMAQLKGVLLSLAKDAHSPGDLVIKINNTLFGAMERQMYITLSAVELAPDGVIKIARAGHMPALVRSDSHIKEIRPSGMGVGLVEGETFDNSIEEISFRMKNGDICLLYTDGLNELRNKKPQQMGILPVKEEMMRFDGDDANMLNAGLKALTDSFSSGAEQHDDITFVSFIYHKADK